MEARLAALTRRVYQLESGAPPSSRVACSDLRFRSLRPLAEPAVEEAEPEPVKPSARIGKKSSGEAGSAVVGALILVIGVALFLGYSLTQLGPAGKVAIGFAVGFSMLLAGITLRGNERYGAFATSLIGGGWAAVYFTAYAAHALEPAQVIASPTAGALFLFLVSLGMVVHALWYESEHGTALAFMFSFVSLNVAPLTGFSVYATLLLTLSIVALAYFRQWFRLAVTGVILAYATFVIRGDAPEPACAMGALDSMARVRSLRPLGYPTPGLQRGIERSVFLLNACGFIGASLLYRWDHVGPFLFASAAAYLISTLIRARFHADGAGGKHTCAWRRL